MTRFRQGLATQRGLAVRVKETYIAGLEVAAAYRQALAEFQRANADLQRQTNTLKRFVNDVARAPSSVRFVDISGARRAVPASASLEAQWSACEYPTSSDLQAALDRRYAAREQLTQLWSQLPAAVRQQLTAPPRS